MNVFKEILNDITKNDYSWKVCGSDSFITKKDTFFKASGKEVKTYKKLNTLQLPSPSTSDFFHPDNFADELKNSNQFIFTRGNFGAKYIEKDIREMIEGKKPLFLDLPFENCFFTYVNCKDDFKPSLCGFDENQIESLQIKELEDNVYGYSITIPKGYKSLSFEANEGLSTRMIRGVFTIEDLLENEIKIEHNGIQKAFTCRQGQQSLASATAFLLALDACVQLRTKHIEAEIKEEFLIKTKTKKGKIKNKPIIKNITYIFQNKNSIKKGYFGNRKDVKWTHKFTRRGHWRKIGDKSIGKNRKDEYCLFGRTWVKDSTINKDKDLPMINKTRVVKGDI